MNVKPPDVSNPLSDEIIVGWLNTLEPDAMKNFFKRYGAPPGDQTGGWPPLLDDGAAGEICRIRSLSPEGLGSLDRLKEISSLVARWDETINSMRLQANEALELARWRKVEAAPESLFHLLNQEGFGAPLAGLFHQMKIKIKKFFSQPPARLSLKGRQRVELKTPFVSLLEPPQKETLLAADFSRVRFEPWALRAHKGGYLAAITCELFSGRIQKESITITKRS